MLNSATIWAVTFANPAPIPTALCVAGALASGLQRPRPHTRIQGKDPKKDEIRSLRR